jgi:hypothetical protein
MYRTPLTLVLATALVGIGGMACALAVELQPYPKQGQLIQRLNAFDNPESAVFTADGKYVFISNSAELGNVAKGFHWTRNQGYVSKLEVQRDGTLKLVNEKLVTGLTAPLGMAISTVATRKFPRGTIFLAEACASLYESDGTPVTDPKLLAPQVVAFNVAGKILGRISLGAGSAAQKVSGVVGTVANGIAFDKAGNLYVADSGFGGEQYVPPVIVKGGVYLFPVSSLDALADDQDAPLQYIPVPDGGPDGIEVAPDGAIHLNTVGLAPGLKDPAAGGMYRLQQSDFKSGRLPAPFSHGFGALDGLDFAGANRLDTEVKDTNSLVVTPLGGNKSYRLMLDKAITFAGPADIAVHKMGDGSYLLLVPELSGTSPNNKNNPVTVIRLPADF